MLDGFVVRSYRTGIFREMRFSFITDTVPWPRCRAVGYNKICSFELCHVSLCARSVEKNAPSRKKKHTSRRRTATHNEPLPVPLSSTCPCSTAPRNIAPNNPGPHVLWPHLAVVTPLCVTRIVHILSLPNLHLGPVAALTPRRHVRIMRGIGRAVPTHFSRRGFQEGPCTEEKTRVWKRRRA